MTISAAAVPGREVDHRDRALARDVPHRVDPDLGAAAGGAGELARLRAAPAPVRHVGLAADEHDVVGGDADVERAENAAARDVELQQAVRQVAADVEPLAVGGHGEAGRDLLLARGAPATGRRIERATLSVASAATSNTTTEPLTSLRKARRPSGENRSPVKLTWPSLSGRRTFSDGACG